MRNKFRKLCIISGAVLIFSAFCLCVYNIYESKTAGKRSQTYLTELKSAIENAPMPTEPPIDENTEDDLFAQYDEPEPAEMPTFTLEENCYCGYLEIADLGLELPVINDFSYEALNTAPCRYSGSPDGSDLVIAAHNYSSHFGKLSSLSDGSRIVFTDCSGKNFYYSIISIEEIRGSNAEEMLSKDNTPWDLTLFTCNLSGKMRITVRAERIEQSK